MMRSLWTNSSVLSRSLTVALVAVFVSYLPACSKPEPASNLDIADFSVSDIEQPTAIQSADPAGDQATIQAAGQATAQEPPVSQPTSDDSSDQKTPITHTAPKPYAQAIEVLSGQSTPAHVGEPWGSVKGMTMFRGNPSRTYYGTGPVPRTQPKTLWRYPEKPMCAESCVGKSCKQWCGLGWTGQPAVYERADGVTEVIFGAYDRHVHFVDAATGKPTRPPFPTGDIIKGSVTVDPDGFPLLYFGSRDNYYRILALDRDLPTEIFHLNGNKVRRRLWNDDWDSNGAIVNDRLFIGGENSWFYVVKLNRGRDAKGKVKIDPVVEIEMPGWTDEMMRMLHPDRRDTMVSIESSPVVFGNRVYWTNSGGMVVGVDWTRVKDKQAEIVFTFWTGDDVDSTPVIDEKGHLYISVQKELDNGRGGRASRERVEEVGQLIKLDPMNPLNPLIWSVAIPSKREGDKGGIWSTPALDLKRGLLIVTTHPGDLLAVDRNSGSEMWRTRLGHHEWSSPLVIGDSLVVGRCLHSGVQAFDLTAARNSVPPGIWTTQAPRGCVESTPTMWRGRLYVGSRDGFFYGLAADK
jgi:outer membrane protein assembly factor BamB